MVHVSSVTWEGKTSLQKPEEHLRWDSGWRPASRQHIHSPEDSMARLPAIEARSPHPA